RKAIEEAGAVKVAETGDAGGVGVGFEVAPVPQLHKGGIHLVRGRRRPLPARLRKHLIWSKLQPVLPLGTCEDIQDRAIELSFLCTDVAEQVAGSGEGLCAHRRSSRGRMAPDRSGGIAP